MSAASPSTPGAGSRRIRRPRRAGSAGSGAVDWVPYQRSTFVTPRSQAIRRGTARSAGPRPRSSRRSPATRTSPAGSPASRSRRATCYTRKTDPGHDDPMGDLLRRGDQAGSPGSSWVSMCPATTSKGARSGRPAARTRSPSRCATSTGQRLDRRPRRSTRSPAGCHRIRGRHWRRQVIEDRCREDSASTVYGSAVGNSSTSVAGATGGSPPVRKMRVGRSGGMLNGISIEIRPSVRKCGPVGRSRSASNTSSWEMPASKSRIALVSTSTPLAGSRHAGRGDPRRFTVEQHPRQVHRVAPDVPNRAPPPKARMLRMFAASSLKYEPVWTADRRPIRPASTSPRAATTTDGGDT